MKVRLFMPALLMALAGGSASPSTSQSLSEVAKNERARRARVGKESPAPVIREKDLESVGGQPTSSTVVAPTPAEAPEIDTKEPEERRPTEKEIRDLREQWDRIWSEQMTEARKNLEVAKNDVYQCRSAERYFFVPLAIDCNGVDLRLAAAEARLKQIERNRYNWELLLPEKQRPIR
jgi:hypothetical protein